MGSKALVRVTEVLDYLTEPELLAWMLRTSKAKRERASEDALLVGTYVDVCVQADLKGVDRPPQTLVGEALETSINCLKAWDGFRNDRPDILAGIVGMQEEVSDGVVVGHPDLIFDNGARRGIIDVKTSGAMYPKYWTQTAEYAKLKWGPGFLDDFLKIPGFLGILRLDKKTGIYHYVELDTLIMIRYEVEMFEAYHKAYTHNFMAREFIRQQLEEGVLNVS